MTTRPTASATPPASTIVKCTVTGLPCLRGPGQLVALGFRHWMAGYMTGEIGHWSACWSLYEQRIGADAARHVVGDLSGYVKSVAWAANRQIELLPQSCRGFCRDECAAVGLIAATQHTACPALRACAAALLANDHCDEVMDQAKALAGSLRDAGQVLPPHLIEFAWPHHNAPHLPQNRQ